MKKKSGRMVPNCVPKNEEPRIPRKKGQPAGSDKHSDLYTDENPVGTIQGLGFKDVDTAKASVKRLSVVVRLMHTRYRLQLQWNNVQKRWVKLLKHQFFAHTSTR